MAVEPNGKVVLAGASQDSLYRHTFAVARLNADGTPDNTFGTRGAVKNYIYGSDSSFDDAHAVAIQPDGKIVASGLYSHYDDFYRSSLEGIAVARYNDDGSLDNTFVINGTSKIALSTTQDVGNSVAIQPDGKIVGGGVAGGGLYSGSFAIVRYLPNDVTGVRVISSSTPTSYPLDQNYPNPFNPSTKIDYQLSEASHVTLRVYDIPGGQIATIVDAQQSAGVHTVRFDGSRFASGVYFYELKAGNFVETKKMILTK